MVPRTLAAGGEGRVALCFPAMSVERAVPGEAGWESLAPHHLARYLFAAGMARGKRVLDAGTGAGYGAALLKAESGGGAREVIGVDIDEGAIAAAGKTYGGEGVRFLVDDCQMLAKVTGPFELICNFENIEHLREPGRFLAAAAQLLAPGGALLISTPDRANTPPFKDGKPDNPYHFFEWYREEFLALLSPHFKKVEIRVQVESHGMRARADAVKALRQGITWSNPVMAFLWRKKGRVGKGREGRSWRAIEALAAGTVGDYPIVEQGLASIWGKSYAHFAICSV